MGLVALEGMEFFARHGYYEEERKIGNRFGVDVEIETDFHIAAENDDLDGTVNYERVYDIVSQVMQTETLLLEHIAGNIISGIRNQFPKVGKVKVKVSKYNPPIGGVCHRALITMEG